MKVLKRPMFKYGGDVKKQGIMHGMNGLRDGGVATTMADALGMANGGIIRQGYNQGLSVQPNYMGGPMQNFYESIDDRPDSNIPIPKKMSAIEYAFRPAPKETSIFRNFIAGPKTKVGREKAEEKRLSSLLKPNEVIDQETLTTEYPQEFPTTAELAPYGKVLTGEAKPTDKPLNAPDAVTGEGLPKVTSNKEKDAARLKRIYDIMGVDEAKKDAVYNSLIDLSQAQAIDTKDISGSINRAVGALSRRADKVTDLKDKGKAALASGTIQDMFKDKTSQYLKNARDYADLKGISLEKAYEQLGLVKKGGLGGQYIDYSGKQGTGLASSEDTLASFMSGQKGYKDNVLTKKEFKEAVKEGKYTSPIDVIIKENITEDGLYKIGMSVIRVKDGKPSYEINRQ